MKTTVISECRMSITVCHTYALSILPDLSATDLTDISQSVAWLCLRRYSEMIDASDQRHHKLLTQDMNLCGCPVIGVGGGGNCRDCPPPLVTPLCMPCPVIWSALPWSLSMVWACPIGCMNRHPILPVLPVLRRSIYGWLSIAHVQRRVLMCTSATA